MVLLLIKHLIGHNFNIETNPTAAKNFYNNQKITSSKTATIACSSDIFQFQ